MLNHIENSIDFGHLFQHRSILALAIVAIASFVSIPPAQAHDVATGYINSAEQFPQTKASQVRQTIRLMVPNIEIDRLKIVTPPGINVGNNIALYNDTERRSLPSLIQYDSGSEIEIYLPQTLSANTQLTIDLNHVDLWGLSRIYQVYAHSLTNSSYTYIGSIEFHRY